ncbi:S-layer homology domain-containing protein [Acetivibrio sp. MSJd-27]|uniref:S-layer homology domain-containing protein n=1 Tax=Acetivibrio sp. MSJd-27 TaxID=2841523 RepID=UPI001C1029DF|nr:S-layer homology domain-containing protein [Acetivibrio sp. MSJd-27]MBU5450076.1 S-layer homology domain-containing protein [Acetivibrio sp. MSJd-27]
MKKKFLSCCIALTLILGSVPATLLAEDSQSSLAYTVEREDDGEYIYHHFSLRGALPAAAGREAKMVAVPAGTTVYDDQTVKALDQTTAAADGNYTFAFTLAEAGDYMVEIRFNGLDDKQRLQVSIKEKSFYTDIIAHFNEANASASTLAGYVDTYSADLGLYTEFFDRMSAAGKTGVGERLKKHSGTFRIDNINRIYNEEHILAFLQYQSAPSDIMELIAFYEEGYFNLGSQKEAENIYSSFLTLPAVARNAAISKWTGKPYSSFEEVRDTFNEAVILGAFSSMSNAKLHPVLKENNDYIKLKNYETLTELQVDSILNAMRKNSGKINSIASFRSEYEKAYSALMNEVGKPTASPSGGGGTGAANPSGPNTSIGTGGSTTAGKPDTVVPGQGEFTDLVSVPWAVESIHSLFELGIINGKEKGIFAPNDNITREEFAKIIVSAFHLMDENAKCSFTDLTEEDWSYPYVASAKKHEMVKGYEDGRFGKADPVTRQDMAVIIYRAMVNLKLVEGLDSVKTGGLFVDQNAIAPYALNSVIMLKNISLVSGNDQQEFQPESNATRAEVAVLMNRVLNYKN